MYPSFVRICSQIEFCYCLGISKRLKLRNETANKSASDFVKAIKTFLRMNGFVIYLKGHFSKIMLTNQPGKDLGGEVLHGC